MRVTAWNNGQHHVTGAGYGFKLSAEDRNRFFKKEWKSVFLSIPGVSGEVEVNIDKTSFWSETCRELISKEIGEWLINSGLAPWPARQPPKFFFEQKEGKHFQVKMQ